MPPHTNIGKRLKISRMKHNLTQAEVAKNAGIHSNYYARIERDEVNPSLDVFEDIVRVLKVKSSDLKHNLTQAEVAKNAGIHSNYYARIERDEVNPSLDVFEDIVRVLKVKS